VTIKNLQFVDELPPSSPKGSRQEFQGIEDALKTQPNRWAKVKAFPRKTADGKHSMQGYSFSSQCNSNYRKYLSQKRGFETAARTVGDEVIVYARYTGGEQA